MKSIYQHEIHNIELTLNKFETRFLETTETRFFPNIFIYHSLHIRNILLFFVCLFQSLKLFKSIRVQRILNKVIIPMITQTRIWREEGKGIQEERNE